MQAYGEANCCPGTLLPHEGCSGCSSRTFAAVRFLETVHSYPGKLLWFLCGYFHANHITVGTALFEEFPAKWGRALKGVATVYANPYATYDETSNWAKDTASTAFDVAAITPLVGAARGAVLAGKAAKGAKGVEAARVVEGAGEVVISNPIPQNGRFATVMPKKYAEQILKGQGSLSGGSEAWVTAADDLKGISTVEEAAKRLTLIDEKRGFEASWGCCG